MCSSRRCCSAAAAVATLANRGVATCGMISSLQPVGPAGAAGQMAAGVSAHHCSPPRLSKHTGFLLTRLLFLTIIGSEPGQRASAIPDRSLRVQSSSQITAVEPLLCSRLRSRVWTSCGASCFPSALPVIGRCSLLMCWLPRPQVASSFFFCYCLQCAKRDTRLRACTCAFVRRCVSTQCLGWSNIDVLS